MNLTASVFAAPVLGILQRGRRFRVLHLFERVVNLVSEAGEVVSLVGDRDLLGPFAVVALGLADRIPTIFAESELFAGAGEIAFPAFAVSLAGVRSWDPRPCWAAARAAVNVSRGRDDLRTAGDAAWFDAGRNVASVAAAIAPGEPMHLVRAAMELAGRGEGLTPAGDDVLIGVVHAVWARWSDERALAVSTMVADAARARTTTLSASWLDAAARGEAALPWHEWVAVWAADEPSADRLANAAAGVRALGDSSGRVALAAFLGAAAALRPAL